MAFRIERHRIGPSMQPDVFIRLVNSVCRERGIDKNLVLSEIERALLQQLKASFDVTMVLADHISGEIRAFDGDKPVDIDGCGTLVKRTTEQVLVRALKESEGGRRP